MKRSCPNSDCPFYEKNTHVVKDGTYFRQNDSRTVQRFRCLNCQKRFSAAFFSLEYKQKKRRINYPLFKLLTSGVSMRRSAQLLGVHRNTIQRKFIYLAQKARISQAQLLKKLENKQVEHLQFDDLITSEHTKLKPLTVTAAVDAKSRLILAAEVSSIPPFGYLAAIFRRKYPGQRRKNEHKKGLQKMFEQIQKVVSPYALIGTDEHPTYPIFVNKFLPLATHQRFKGGRGAIVGQGELKKLKHDPLFMLNHTYAMLRANINRLFRRTWCTTKKKEMLKNHLDIYIAFHNAEIAKWS